MTSKFKLRTTEQFSSEKVLELLFYDDFYLTGGCSSDEECSEGPSYLGNDELHPQDLDRVLEKLEAAVMNVKMMK